MQTAQRHHYQQTLLRHDAFSSCWTTFGSQTTRPELISASSNAVSRDQRYGRSDPTATPTAPEMKRRFD